MHAEAYTRLMAGGQYNFYFKSFLGCTRDRFLCSHVQFSMRGNILICNKNHQLFLSSTKKEIRLNWLNQFFSLFISSSVRQIQNLTLLVCSKIPFRNLPTCNMCFFEFIVANSTFSIVYKFSLKMQLMDCFFMQSSKLHMFVKVFFI